MKKQYIAPKAEVITMEQSGSILVGSTPISDFNADGVTDLIINTEDKDINWD